MNKLKLLFDHQDKILKNRLKKINEHIDPSRRGWDEFEVKLLSAIEKYNDVVRRLRNRDEFVDGPFREFYIKLNELRWDFDSQLSNSFIRTFEGADESLRERLTDSANESGDFDRYEEDEYNAERTHENIIDNDEYSNIISNYMGDRAKGEVFKSLLTGILKILKKYEEEEVEPEFDGNFDEMNVAKPVEKDPDEELALSKIKEIIQIINQVLQTENGYGEAWDKIISISDDIPYISELDISDAIMEVKDEILQWVDDNLSNDSDCRFVSITEGERDLDATWEAISEESTSELISNYASTYDVKSFIEDIADGFDEIIQEYEEYKNNGVVPGGDSSEEDEGDGSEYNE